MNDDKRLTDALRRLKEADADMSASPAVEERLLADVRGRARQRRRGWLTAVLAGAALVVLVVFIGAGTWLNGRKTADGVPQVVQAREVTTEFYPLFYSTVPAAQTHIVRMQVPRGALVRMGLESGDRIDRAGTVLADVLIGEDGLARAVRFVRKVSEE